MTVDTPGIRSSLRRRRGASAVSARCWAPIPRCSNGSIAPAPRPCILLDAGATISAMDKQGATPLAHAARNNLPDMVEFLRRRGAE
jgi:ankyrin repeat protein